MPVEAIDHSGDIEAVESDTKWYEKASGLAGLGLLAVGVTLATAEFATQTVQYVEDFIKVL